MLTNLSREAADYHGLYANKKIVIIPCDPLSEENSHVLANDAMALREQNIDIRFRTLTRDEGDKLISLTRPDMVEAPTSQRGGSLVMNALVQVAGDAKGKIEELILLRNDGGITGRDNNIMPVVSDIQIDKLLESDVPFSADVISLLQYIRLCLKGLGKIVAIKPDGLSQEVNTWMGSGTMFFDSGIVKAGPVQLRERKILESVCEANVRAGWFSAREDASEWDELMNAHTVVRAKLSALGGYTLRSIDWRVQELNLLWGAVEGSGLGPIIMEQVLKEANGNAVFACTLNPAASKLFENAGFVYLGTIEQAKEAKASMLPVHLQKYDTKKKGRNPHLFFKPGATT